MKFRIGPPPNSLSDSELHSGEWKQLRELPFWPLQLCALLVGILATILALFVWKQLEPNITIDESASWEIPLIIFGVLVSGVVLQIATHPGCGISDKSMVGIWPSRFTFYSYFEGQVTKARYILAMLLPCIIMVILPIFATMIMGHISGWLIFISCVASFSFGFGPILAISAAIQLPANAKVAGQGLQAFWREQIGANT